MSTSAATGTEGAIDPGTTIGTVRLTVSDLGRSRSFYEQALGLRATELHDGAVALATGDGRALIELRGDSSAPGLDPRATGLFHLAVLVPSRRDLAFALARLAQARWPLDGASDHLVSEALYLSDPDGNGIEIYRDRPREQWRRVGGRLQMATLPLELRGLADELPADGSPQELVAKGAQIGHVHLRVSELHDVEAFYAGVLGFEVMIRGYPGALFLSAGGYHHHVGVNTWHSAGSGPPPTGSVGLRSFEVELPDEPALEKVLARISDAQLPVKDSEIGAPVEGDSGGVGPLVRDPSGNAVLLRAR